MRAARSILSTVSLLVLGGLAGAQEAPRYLRVKAPGARILNVADEKGIAVAQPAVGSLVRVFDENQVGWMLVEIPGGFAVWVHGKFMTATDTEGVFEITKNQVNIRPGPASDVTNFPLPVRLHAGDRVQVIEVLDDNLPLAENWVRVWSPIGVRAWIDGKSLEPLPDESEGDALWNEALAALTERVAPPQPKAKTGATTEAAATTPEGIAADELDLAQAELEKERAKEAPDYLRVRGLVEAVLQKSPTGPTAIEARETLRTIDALVEAVNLKSELERLRAERARRAAENQRDAWEKAREKDPLLDVFSARGVLFRRLGPDGVSKYFLRFGGETVAELFCVSGRYDLDVFAGYEVGVHAQEIAGESTKALDVARLEILRKR